MAPERDAALSCECVYLAPAKNDDDMRILAFFVLAALMWLTPLRSRAQDTLQLQVDVVYLSSNLLKGREAGTPYERQAAAYIASRFEEIGLAPKGTDGWYQPFEFTYKPNPHSQTGEKRTGLNVVGYLDNEAPTTIVIGAHFDHLGMGHFGSRHVGEPDIHNGADDNASGVAALLCLAEKLKTEPLKGHNYLFIAFSAEELGLFGSKYYAEHPTIPLDSVAFMLNMDMVGRLKAERKLVVNGAGTSPLWKPTLQQIDTLGIRIATTESGIGPSDHTSFYLKNIPVLHFFTGQHTDYHKPEDDSEKVNYAGLADICQLIYNLVAALDDHPRIEFRKTKDEQERKAAAFKVSLGVMPDYTYEGKGMRVDAVVDGRPGARAGMQAGDVIIRIGEVEVEDIYGYMEGLSRFNKGDKAQVTVLREGKTLTLEVVFEE